MNHKKIAILQSNYIPWKGYFDMIAAVDEFILYDDMQFTKNDWRNRNKIKTPDGMKWITIPVGQNINRRIREVLIPDTNWQRKHWHSLEANYRKSPYFQDVAVWLEPLYLTEAYENLSSLNRRFIVEICRYLNINTVISNSWDYDFCGGKIERLIDLCTQAGGTEYLSGPSAKNYIDEELFLDKGVTLTWFDYSNYREYPQLWGGFSHEVTILDLLFNCGKKSPLFMRYAPL